MAQVTRQRDITVIELGARYDSLDLDALEEVGGLMLTEAAIVEPPHLVLDMSQTVFIGSAFIELMVRTWKRITERGGQMALCGLHPFCVDVLCVTRLDSLWRFFPSRGDAIAAIAPEKDA